MDEGTSLYPIKEGQQAQRSINGTPESLTPADRPQRTVSGSSSEQSILPEATQQVLQDLLELPGRMLPPETVQHLKNAGRETLLALYSLWQNIDRAAKSDSGEKVRKHIKVE